MATVSNATASSVSQTSTGAAKGIQDLDLNKFIDLMIAELQNQDPLNPLDNNQMLQQITQIREIGASDKLKTTLDSVLVGQNLTTASSMIGKHVSALADDNSNVEGVVDSASVAVDDNGNRTVRINIGDQAVKLTNVRQVVGG